jgi:site-specific DNA-adenine methylase
MIIYLVGETLDAAFGQEGDSDEEDAIVNQVLDEIGISMNEKVCFIFKKQKKNFFYLDSYCTTCSSSYIWYGIKSTTNE